MIRKTSAMAMLFAMSVFLFPSVAPGAQEPRTVVIPDMGKPSYPPQTGEYFPVEGKGYPQSNTNPYAHTRTVGFMGAPLEIYTQINMVTQIQFPAAPVLVNIGKPEAYTLEVVPEFHSIFVKPVAEVEITNLIVTTEKGVYTFILKENPFRPWDIRVVVTDPYRNVNPGDTQSLVTMAFTGRRMPEFQFNAMDIRSPESSTYVYDPLVKMGCRIVLRRSVFIADASKVVHWIEFSNVLPPKITGDASGFALDERSVWTPGLERVAVPGTRTTALPLLGKGDRVDMFLIATAKSLPKIVEVRCMLQGSRQLPVVFKLPTTTNVKGGSSSVEAVSTNDQKLTKMYNDMIRKENISQSNQNGEVNQPEGVGKNASGTSVPVPGNAPVRDDASETPGKQPGDGKIYYPEP